MKFWKKLIGGSAPSSDRIGNSTVSGDNNSSSLGKVQSFHDAAFGGDLETVRHLLKECPDLAFSRNKRGATPLHQAAWEGRANVVEFLLANNVDANAKDQGAWTPLHMAARNGHDDVVELLLVGKADVDARKEDGLTPLHLAAINGYKKIAELLLAKNAELNAKDASGRTPLHHAAQSSVGFGIRDIIELLLRQGANVNVKDNNGNTPLHLEAGKGNWNMAEFLLDHDADCAGKNSNGETPLDLALANGHERVADLLRQHSETVPKNVLGNWPIATAESSLDNASASVIRAFERHVQKLVSRLREEPETQNALNRVAAIVRQHSRMIGAKVVTSAADGEMHSFSCRNGSQKIRLEVTTVPCQPNEASGYFQRIYSGGYADFLNRLLYLPPAYEAARAEGIQVFAHLFVVVNVQTQREESERDQVVVHLCMLPHGDGNQRYCPTGVTPIELLNK
jgi:ankyrin repeat protein